MIYGQPITFGGGDGNELIVTAPTGSTVTITKDGKTKTATEDNGTWTFKGLDAGDWTVTATLDGWSKSVVATVVSKEVGIVFVSDTFADNDWSDIIAACQGGSVPSTWVVGNSKTMTINGKSYQIDIIGKNHDTYMAGGTAPLTFQMHDCYATTYQMNSTATNDGGYDSSAMHTTHLPAIKALMPSEVQAAIKPVNKVSGVGDSSTSGVETVSCDLFLLAMVEIFGTTQNSVAGEGTQYDYYKAGNSKIKNLNGAASYWWCRSPYSGINGFCAVTYEGAVGSSLDGYPTNTAGVAFAFCF